MKTQKIYVRVNGATLQLSNGRAVAVYPPQKGEPVSYMLTESGKMVAVKGARIQGVGIPRFLQDNGFALARPGDEAAARLADLLDVKEGTKLVEEASYKRVAEIQRSFANQEALFVPFDEEKIVVPIKVDAPQGRQTSSFDLTTGFSSGCVHVGYIPGVGSDIAIASGWILGTAGSADRMLRNTEYGGLMERAVYVICNSGLGTLVPGYEHLAMPSSTTVDDPFPRGMMAFTLANGDLVQVGADGGDDLSVKYWRMSEDGTQKTQLYSRTGMTHPRLGEVIGCIAAVLVRVAELDAQPVRKATKKAA